MCRIRNETISHIVSECGKLAQMIIEIMIIDMAIPGDTRVCGKELEKIKKYRLLKDEITRLWQMKKVVVIPIVVGALGTITTKFEK